jgi:transcriptional regulator with XRE-family HTH domain
MSLDLGTLDHPRPRSTARLRIGPGQAMTPGTHKQDRDSARIETATSTRRRADNHQEDAAREEVRGDSVADLPEDQLAGDGPGATLQERLQYLWAKTPGPSGRAMSLNELVAGVEEATGVSIGRSTLNKLLTGKVTNPHLETIHALARFWGVPIEFFTDDAVAQKTAAELGLLTAMRDQGVQHLAMRASGLAPETLELISRLVEQARVAEGLDRPGRKLFRGRRDEG